MLNTLDCWDYGNCGMILLLFARQGDMLQVQELYMRSTMKFYISQCSVFALPDTSSSYALALKVFYSGSTLVLLQKDSR